MRQLFLFTLLASELVSSGAQRFLSLDFVKETSPNHPANGNLDKRQESILEPLTNTGTRYIANVSIGTPPQPLPLLLSTGSSEVWMSSSSATFCTDASTANLCLGTFNSSASTTYTPVDNPVFNVTYSSGFGSTGSYFTDQITVGNTTLVSQQMGLANYTTVGRGVLGLGLPDTESLCQDEPCTTSYPTFVDQLVLQGKIITRAYSLYLNDQYAKSGSVLFGAVDVKKYTGDLIALPILPNAQTGVYDSLSVAWTNLTVQSDTKLSAGLVPVNFTAPALIAAGTTYSYITDSVAKSIYNLISATYNNQSQSYTLLCSTGAQNITLNFQFGGYNGPMIRVPLAQLLIPLLDTSNNPVSNDLGLGLCQVVLLPTNGSIILGHNFLRSAYVVYDLEYKQISIAQANLNSTTSDIREIVSGVHGVPGVVSTAGTATPSAASGTSSSVSYSTTIYTTSYTTQHITLTSTVYNDSMLQTSTTSVAKNVTAVATGSVTVTTSRTTVATNGTAVITSSTAAAGNSTTATTSTTAPPVTFPLLGTSATSTTSLPTISSRSVGSIRFSRPPLVVPCLAAVVVLADFVDLDVLWSSVL